MIKKRNPTLVKETLPSKKKLDVKPIADKKIKKILKIPPKFLLNYIFLYIIFFITSFNLSILRFNKQDLKEKKINKNSLNVAIL